MAGDEIGDDAVVEVLESRRGFGVVVDEDHGGTAPVSDFVGEAGAVHAGEALGDDEKVDGSVGEQVEGVFGAAGLEDPMSVSFEHRRQSGS